MPELYRWLPLQKIPVPGIGIAVRSRGEHRHIIVKREVAESLCEYSDFRNLDTLVAETESRLKGSTETRESIARAFHEAIECGLLIPFSRCKAAVADTPNQLDPLQTLIIPTAGRPVLLKRCIESFLRDASRSGRRIQIIASDNSGNPKSETSCRLELEKAGQLKGSTATFVGAIEAQAIRKEILRVADVPIDTLNFLLGGTPGKPNVGANRNLLLLLGSGRRVLSADDDMVCEPRTFRDASCMPAVFCGSTISAVEYSAVPHRQSLEERTVRSSHSVWDSHDEVLGRQCGALLRDSLKDDSAAIAGDAVRSIIRGTGSVRASYSGVYGDPGIHCRPSLAFMLNQGPNSPHPAGICDEALTTGDMVIAAKAKLISRGGPWPGGCFGIDLSEITPPFMPSYRGEDWLFGVLLTSDLNSYVAHLPVAALHRPPHVRVTVNYDRAVSIRMADIMRGLCMSTVAARSSLSTRDRLYQMGTELSQASHDDLYEWLQGVAWSYYRTLMTTLERIRKGTDTPESVIHVTEHLCRAVDSAVRRSDFFIPWDQSSDSTTKEALGDMFSVIHEFARGLREWPAIVAAAEGLAEKLLGIEQLRPECVAG